MKPDNDAKTVTLQLEEITPLDVKMRNIEKGEGQCLGQVSRSSTSWYIGLSVS